MIFNIKNVGTESRGNDKVGNKLFNFFKGYVYNQDDETIDLIPQTTVIGKKSRKRSKFTTISMKTFEGLKAVCHWIEGVNTEEIETSTGEVAHFFVNEEGEREPKAQSEFYGAVIDGKTLSETCELGIFRHYYFGFQKAVYPKKDANGKVIGYGVRNEQITSNGVRACYAVVNGALVLEPMYYDDSCNFTDEVNKKTGELVSDTKFEDALEFYNKKNPYNAVFKFADNCFIDIEFLQELCEENGIECKDITRTLENDAFVDSYSYTEFSLEDVENEEGEEVEATQQPTLTLASMSALNTKSKVKKYAKNELGLNLTFATSETIDQMKTKILTTVNGVTA